jgi:hypothetical protein
MSPQATGTALTGSGSEGKTLPAKITPQGSWLSDFGIGKGETGWGPTTPADRMHRSCEER